MHRFFVPKSEIQGSEIVFSGSEWRHCQTVLRNKTGERVTIFDGEGSEYLAEITQAQAKQAQLRILSRTFTEPPTYSISLAQALPKNKVMDLIVQKATELGVRDIIPIHSERSTIRLDVEQAKEKVDRWREITIDAAKQCGLNWLPRIRPLHSVAEAVSLRSDYQHAFVGSLQPEARPLWDYLQPSSARLKILLMIGPEGDFTPAELAAARSAGFSPLSLGPLVLRCDTAAIYAVSTLSYELRRS